MLEAKSGTSAGLQVTPASGWRSGLGHMLRGEGARWWRARRWRIHAPLRTAVINGFPGLGLLIWIVPVLASEEDGLRPVPLGARGRPGRVSIGPRRCGRCSLGRLQRPFIPRKHLERSELHIHGYALGSG